jgi:hypothetical protein
MQHVENLPDELNAQIMLNNISEIENEDSSDLAFE